MKIKQAQEIVERVLTSYPQTRDNDQMLILKVWAVQNPALRGKEFSFIDFSRGFLDGDYHKTESITRARRKAQEENPELRGKNYIKRHEHQKDVKKELGYAG